MKYGEDYEYEVTHRGYAHYSYKLTALSDTAREMTAREAAVLVDGSDLPFGGRDISKNGDIYTGTVHTD